MGIGGISIWQLLIILVIVLLLFGTKRLRGLGTDLGGAIKGFKKAITDEGGEKTDPLDEPPKVNAEEVRKTQTESDTVHTDRKV